MSTIAFLVCSPRSCAAPHSEQWFRLLHHHHLHLSTGRTRLEWEGGGEEEDIWDSGAAAGFGDPRHATDDDLDVGGMAASPAGKKKNIWFQMHVHQIWKTKLSSKNEVNNLAADIITKWLLWKERLNWKNKPLYLNNLNH
jgi:hypothetical protein